METLAALIRYSLFVLGVVVRIIIIIIFFVLVIYVWFVNAKALTKSIYIYFVHFSFQLDRKAGISSDTGYDDLNVLTVLSTFAVETDLMGYLMIFIGTSTPLRRASQFGHAANNSSYGSYNRRVSGTFMCSDVHMQ